MELRRAMTTWMGRAGENGTGLGEAGERVATSPLICRSWGVGEMREPRQVLVTKASRVFWGVEMSAGELKCALPVSAASRGRGDTEGG